MIKKIFLTSLIMLLNISFSVSQSLKPEKSRIYKSLGEGLNKEAVLVLYNDNTFTNYGIYADETNKDWYVWYTTGKCLKLADKIIFRSNDTIKDVGSLIKIIKDSYLTLKEHALICKDYEFVQLKYKDYTMFPEDSLIIDGAKKITYLEKKQ